VRLHEALSEALDDPVNDRVVEADSDVDCESEFDDKLLDSDDEYETVHERLRESLCDNSRDRDFIGTSEKDRDAVVLRDTEKEGVLDSELDKESEGATVFVKDIDREVEKVRVAELVAVSEDDPVLAIVVLRDIEKESWECDGVPVPRLFEDVRLKVGVAVEDNVGLDVPELEPEADAVLDKERVPPLRERVSLLTDPVREFESENVGVRDCEALAEGVGEGDWDDAPLGRLGVSLLREGVDEADEERLRLLMLVETVLLQLSVAVDEVLWLFVSEPAVTIVGCELVNEEEREWLAVFVGVCVSLRAETGRIRIAANIHSSNVFLSR
jgi:hypothetical protein